MYVFCTGACPVGPPHTLHEPGAVVAFGKLAVCSGMVDFTGL